MSFELVATKPGLEELVADPKIYPSRAKRSASRLLRGLNKLGLSFDEAYGRVDNLPPRKRKVIDETNFQLAQAFAFSPIEVPIATGHNGQELIYDSNLEIFTNNYYAIEALRNNHGQPLRMYLHVSPKDDSTYKLAWVMPFALNAQSTLFEALNPYFTSLAFQYDFSKNPWYRDVLSTIVQTRVPSDIVDDNFGRRSLVIGNETPEGINARVQLYLHDADHKNHLRCYEVKIFSAEGKKNIPTTSDIVSESFWQDDENHYCMTDRFGSYPLIPIKDIRRISLLTMFINYEGNSPETMFALLGNLPLSIDGANQWYAKGHFVRGNLELLFKPEWGENNTALVYRQESQKRITPKQIYEAVEGMVAVKGTLTERLAN